MQSNLAKAVVGVVAVAAVVALFIALSGGDDDSDSTTAGGEPAGATSGAEAGNRAGNEGGRDGGPGNGNGGGNGGGGSGQSGDGRPEIVVRGGEPRGGVQRLEYSTGDEVSFRVSSDVADEVHVHGYDLIKDVRSGGSVGFSFPAEIDGVFEIELEERGQQLAELRVSP